MRSHLSTPRRSSPNAARHPAPEPLTTTRRFDSFRTLLGTLLFLVLSAFLASESLVQIAERKEFGPERDRWLNAAVVVDDASGKLFLDRPGNWIRSVVTYDRAPQGQDEEVILGELAAAAPQPDLASEPLRTEPAPEPADPPDSPAIESSTEEPLSPEPEPEPEAPATQLREISEDEPLRVWMGGDSLGQFVAAHVAYRIAPLERSEIAIDYRISTGLARPDYFDWPAHLTAVMAEETRPEAVVFMVGGNDDQAMRLQSVVLEPTTPEWLEEYGRRVALTMDVTAYADTRMMWILLPPMGEERRQVISSQINNIVRIQAESRPWVSVVDIDDLLVDDDGNYARFIVGPDGEQQLARQADDVHITEIASRWVADRVWAEVLSLWPAVGAPPDPTIAPDE